MIILHLAFLQGSEAFLIPKRPIKPSLVLPLIGEVRSTDQVYGKVHGNTEGRFNPSDLLILPPLIYSFCLSLFHFDLFKRKREPKIPLKRENLIGR